MATADEAAREQMFSRIASVFGLDAKMVKDLVRNLLTVKRVVVLLDTSGSMKSPAPEGSMPDDTSATVLRPPTRIAYAAQCLHDALWLASCVVDETHIETLDPATFPGLSNIKFDEYASRVGPFLADLQRRATGSTPLIRRYLQMRAKYCASSEDRVLFIILTDGTPDESQYAVLQAFQEDGFDHVYRTIVLVNDDTSVVGFYDDMVDKNVPRTDVLQHFGAEARQIKGKYTRAQHALRMLIGPMDAAYDTMDEGRPLDVVVQLPGTVSSPPPHPTAPAGADCCVLM